MDAPNHSPEYLRGREIAQDIIESLMLEDGDVASLRALAYELGNFIARDRLAAGIAGEEEIDKGFNDFIDEFFSEYERT